MSNNFDLKMENNIWHRTLSPHEATEIKVGLVSKKHFMTINNIFKKKTTLNKQIEVIIGTKNNENSEVNQQNLKMPPDSENACFIRHLEKLRNYVSLLNVYKIHFNKS